MRNADRPWVAVQSVDIINPDASPITVVTIQNSGRSPALNVDASVQWLPLDSNELFPPPLAHEEGVPSSLIPAGGAQSMTVLKPSQGWSSDLVDSLSNGTKTLWIRGLIDYEDSFGEHHQTRFQYLYIPEERAFSPYGENTAT